MASASQSPSPLAGEGARLSEPLGEPSRSGRGGLPTHAELLARAKWMRANPTEAERRMWSILRAKRFVGHKFKRQVILDWYIADFVNFEHRLIVEADGSQHAESEYDQRRDAHLKAQGFHVLRFWNNEIAKNIEGVAMMIYDALTTSSHLVGEDSVACSVRNLVELGEGSGVGASETPSPRVAREQVPKPTLSSPARGEGLHKEHY